MTPEGRVKAKINKVLAKYPELYKYMPVPAGYGPSSLDYIVCFAGRFIGIEAKAPGKKPTPRQLKTMQEIEAAGGKVFIIDGDTTELEDYLEHLASTSFLQTQNPGRAVHRTGAQPLPGSEDDGGVSAGAAPANRKLAA